MTSSTLLMPRSSIPLQAVTRLIAAGLAVMAWSIFSHLLVVHDTFPANLVTTLADSPQEEVWHQEDVKERRLETGSEARSTQPGVEISELEFVHIPKNSGSAIENVGIRNNVSWGMCAFLPKGSSKCPLGARRMPHFSHKPEGWPFGCAPWHVPPRTYFEVVQDDFMNPYKNQTMFAVVRNPYSRVLSEYYFYSQLVLKLQQNKTHDAKRLNDFVIRKIGAVMNKTEQMKPYYHEQGHWIPQVRRREWILEVLECCCFGGF